MRLLTPIVRRGAWAVVGVAAIATSACSLDKQTQPSLIGPSGLGKQVLVTASPDQLPRDSTSQSVITVEVRDASGKGVPGTIVRVGATSGALVTQNQVTTGGDGKATFGVVAPSQTTIIPNNTIVVTATPVGGDFDSSVTGSTKIALLGVSNSTAPTAAFTVNPSAPEINKVATFDATNSTDEGSHCLDVCTYAWDFDDGTTATGRIVTHSFGVARSYNVALTVTDASGLTSTLRQFVTPLAPAAPTVVMTVAPNPPVVNQTATFTATATAAANHSIVKYEWDFGDGTTTTTFTGSATHTYGARGIYAVTVRVTDDLGQVGSTAATFDLTIGNAQGVNATFFYSPTAPTSGNAVFLNASGSTASNGASITDYKWDWGDGSATEDDGTTATATHTFAPANTYVVKLTVTDSQGRVAFTTQNIAVK